MARNLLVVRQRVARKKGLRKLLEAMMDVVYLDEGRGR